MTVSGKPLRPRTTNFAGCAYRLVFIDQDATLSVNSPEGRFHHSGQFAIYTSLTPEGCAVAIKRYLRADDPPRHVVPLSISIDNLMDLRGKVEASVVWQAERKKGRPSPTWTLSDAAREAGSTGIMYSSRSQPDLTHLVLFTNKAEFIHVNGPALPFTSPD